MQDDFEKVIADYQVSSNERIKHITNEMLMLGHCDSDSHSPLMVCLHPKPCSKSGKKLFSDQEVPQGQEAGDSMEAMEPILVRRSGMGKHYSGSTWRDYDYGSRSDSSYH